MTRLRRGFTLIEVLISVAILAFVVAGISTVLIQQSRASSRQTQQRDLEESGRLALLEIGRSMRMAGYGIAPIAAFDFDRFGCATPGNPSTCPNGGRDRIDAPDEVVVAWRDPTFGRSLTALTATSPYTATLNTATTTDLKAGRIMQILCAGAEPSAYVAVNGDTAAGATTLVVRNLTNADGYFPQTAPTDACFRTGAMFLVERVRYYIANDTDGVPALWKDRGRGVQEKLYRGIEDLQFTYDIGQPPPGSTFAGAAAPACAGTPSWTYGLCSTAETPNEGATAPDWRNDSYDSANRYNGHPVNIRNVTINVVARATITAADRTGDRAPAVGNRPARALDQYHRSVFTLSEQPQNLLMRAHFLPPIFTNSNVGGG